MLGLKVGALPALRPVVWATSAIRSWNAPPLPAIVLALREDESIAAAIYQRHWNTVYHDMQLHAHQISGARTV